MEQKQFSFVVNKNELEPTQWQDITNKGAALGVMKAHSPSPSPLSTTRFIEL